MAVAGEQQQPVESESWKRGNMRIGKMLNEWFGRWELTRFVSFDSMLFFHTLN